MDQFDWERFTISDDPSENVRRLSETILLMFNECFPIIKVRISSRDPPYMSPLVEHLCKIRNKKSRSHRQSENPVLQERINELIRAEQIRAVNERRSSYHTSSKRWWDTVNMITGRQARNAPVSSTIDPKTINLYFQSINTDVQYSTPEVLSIPDGTRIPTIEVHPVWKFLSTLKRTAPGPDELPFWIWMDYAYQLAPTITKVFNFSLIKQLPPCLWKLANITPIPKETPFETCNQLRPISLTNVIMRLFERVVVKQELSPVLKSAIGSDQFAYKEGCNTTLALLTCHHHWLKWLDRTTEFVRGFSFDFSKAFDSVAHAIVCNKLVSLNINPYVINWIVSFLSNRKRRVVMDGFVTEFASVNRGVPQGTVLGPILFSIMVNDIRPVYPERNLLLKYANDLTPRAPVSAHQDHSFIGVDRFNPGW